MRSSVLPVIALALAEASPRFWSDHYVRVSAQDRQHAAKLHQDRHRHRHRLEEAHRAKRQLMDFEPVDSYEGDWIINGKEVDLSPLNGPSSWVELLDKSPEAGVPALVCLPYSGAVSDPATQTADYTIPGTNVTLIACPEPYFSEALIPMLPLPGCTESDPLCWLGYGYAAPDPFGAGPICTSSVVKDCKYSTEETRKVPSLPGGAYPRNYNPWKPGNPRTTAGTAPDGECSVSDSHTQWLDCGIPCPAPFEMTSEELAADYGVGVIVFVVLCACIGVFAMIRVSGKSVNFFVAGRTLPLPIVIATLASQSLDANAALGNLDLGYFYHWWDGAVLPIGLGLSLILNAIFFAAPLNKMQLLTLPDLMRVKFGPLAEVFFSILTIVSFLFLLAGNLVGAGRIVNFLFDLDDVAGIWICCVCVWAYTIAGGLFSVAYTDVAQAALGWLGLVVGTSWVLTNMPTHPGVSPAYPLGDKPRHASGIADDNAYDPIPNALVFNWATILVLGFGNLGALDFQARVFASKTPTVAVIGCVVAGLITWLVGILFSYNSGSIRALYGPSSPHAEFVADSCSQYITVIGLFGPNQCNAIPMHTPTCGEWKPDPDAPLKFLTCSKSNCHAFTDFDGTAGYPPGFSGNFPMNAGIGIWVLLSIVAASMSTGDGAILAMGTVFAHNVVRKVSPAMDDARLLLATRLSTILWAAIAAGIASAMPSQTGYLLVVAFDIMLAGGIVPMFAAVYWNTCKPFAAVAAIVAGSMTRLILEYALPKDGLLLLLGDYAKTFSGGLLDYNLFVQFTDFPDPAVNPNGTFTPSDEALQAACPQYDLEDWTGVDSLVSPFVSLAFLILFNFLPSPDHPFLKPLPLAGQDTGTDTGTDKTPTVRTSDDDLLAPSPSSAA